MIPHGPQLRLAALGGIPSSAKGLRRDDRIRRSNLATNHRTYIPASERYRLRAEECRLEAQTFRDKAAQQQLFRLADDYERKAVLAEAYEPKTSRTA